MTFKEDKAKIDEVEKIAFSLERKIYRAEASLKSTLELKKLLGEILDDVDLLKRLSQNKDYGDIVKKAVNSRKLEEPLSKITAEISALTQSCSEFGAKQEHLHDLISRMKTSSEFSFPGFGEASSFADSCFSLFPEEKIFVAPIYIGLVNLDQAVSSLPFTKEGNTFAFSQMPTKELLDSLSGRSIRSNISIYNKSLKVDFIKSNVLKISADPAKIKRIELLYSEAKAGANSTS